MTIKDIVEMSTKIDGIHESCFRSSGILKYVIWLLKYETSPYIIMSIISDLSAFPQRADELVVGAKESDV